MANEERSRPGTLTPRDRAAFHLEQKSNLTGFLGVTRKKTGFVARIRVSGQKEKLYAGYAKTAEEAARHYDRKARELFGESAVTNFPIEDHVS